MFKKSLIAASFLCAAVPMAAHADWTLSTRALNPGGTITVGAAAQTAATGTVTKTFANGASVAVSVTPAAGYSINTIKVNGVVVGSVPASFTGVDKDAKGLVVSFKADAASLTALTIAAQAGGKASPSGLFNVKPGSTATVTFLPSGGNTFAGITGATALSSVAVPGGGTKVTFVVPAAATTILGRFTGPFVNTTTIQVPQYIDPITHVVGPFDPQKQCQDCHNNAGVGAGVTAAWTAGGHNNGFHPAKCFNCHVGAATSSHFGTTQGACVTCHAGPYAPATAVLGHGADTSCTKCHNSRSAHNASAKGCVDCHSVVQNGNIQDNNGVRAITAEFSKWSHHVTGVTLNNAHCAACHLEGKVMLDPVSGTNKVVTDFAKHAVDTKTHLRNADTDADMQWDPANPNHSTMDNFCMTCHDANGATSATSVAIQAFINTNGLAAAGKTASPSNPFGDTISNRYDKMQRPAVVDVDGQFATGNNSHHAVKGPRYTGRTRFAGARQIASPATFANNSTATLFGKRMTIYDAVTQDGREAFNALYVPLANAGGETAPRTGSAELGDDSTLHCGDCHTVGQWKAGTAKSFNPTKPTSEVAGFVSPAIGAHGSNNEYMLRNSRGTDERHTQDAYTVSAGVVTLKNPNAAMLVCFNCHSYSRYGSIFNATGTTGPHAGEYDASGRCNGIGNTIPFNGYTTGTATDGTQFGSRFEGPRSKYGATAAFAPGFPLNEANRPTTGEQEPDFGNVFGMQCANCHNSGAGNAYGGIHGSKNNQTLEGYTNDPSVLGGSYIDGMGNTTKIMRFLPGLGDAMHVPGTLGGVTGGSVALYKNYSANAAKTVYTILPLRDNRPAVNKKVGSYNYTTGGVTNDTNWEQKGWKQSGPNSTLDANQQQAVGAGCYTLGNSAAKTPGTLTYPAAAVDSDGNAMYPTTGIRPNIMDKLEGPSQGVTGVTAPELWENWGGCDDHSAPIAGGNHGFIKRIVRPVTY